MLNYLKATHAAPHMLLMEHFTRVAVRGVMSIILMYILFLVKRVGIHPTITLLGKYSVMRTMHECGGLFVTVRSILRGEVGSPAQRGDRAGRIEGVVFSEPGEPVMPA